MKILVILAHPDKRSFNHAIAKTVFKRLRKNKHQVRFHDLYQEKFDPVLTAEEIPDCAKSNFVIQKHCKELQEADGIVIIHPNWWGMPPAILKGWVDRVLRAGVAYRFEEDDSGEGIPVGLLRAKVVLIFNTSNTPEKREIKVFGDPLRRIWDQCVFDLCGVKKIHRKNFRVIVTSTLKQRRKWLMEVQKIMEQYFQTGG